MSIERFNTTIRSTLLTASAVTVLLASPAFAQSQTQVDQTSTHAAGSAQRNTSNEPDELSEEEAIIERSFEDDIDMSKVTDVEAGTTADVDQNRISESPESPLVSGESNIAEAVTKDEGGSDVNLSDLPEGTGVIMKDGKVIARTDDGSRANISEGNAQLQANRSERNAQAQAAQPSDASATTRDQADQPQQTDEQRDRYQSLTGKTVVNSTGQEIGAIEEVVIDNENGETSVVITTDDMTETGDVRLLVPMTEMAITGENAVWDTRQTLEELEQSDRYDSDNYSDISNRGAAPDNARDEGLSRR